MRYAVRVEPGKKVRLGDIDPNENGGLDRKTGEELLLPLLEELGELQELLDDFVGAGLDAWQIRRGRDPDPLLQRDRQPDPAALRDRACG